MGQLSLILVGSHQDADLFFYMPIRNLQSCEFTYLFACLVHAMSDKFARQSKPAPLLKLVCHFMLDYTAILKSATGLYESCLGDEISKH